MNIALVGVAKNEDHYIQEWIDYHTKLGFNHIFIYTNFWEYTNSQDHVTVLKVNINGSVAATTHSYNDFKRNKSEGYDWVAFFDLDEFLCLNQHNNVKDFLSNYNDCNAIGINWAMFGNGNQDKVINNNYNVLSRFKTRAIESFEPCKNIKTICRLPCNRTQYSHHVDDAWYNLNKEIRYGPFNEPVNYDIAQLNHYFTKSNEEFRTKCYRGYGIGYRRRKFKHYIHCLGANDIIDTKAYDFFQRT